MPPVGVVALLASGVLAGACAAEPRAPALPMEGKSVVSPPTNGSWTKPPATLIKERLTALQFEVTQHGATEPPFDNELWDQHEVGLYVDVVTGEPLFASTDKFDSGTGWPSFVRPIEERRVVERLDQSHGSTRVEVRSAAGGSHLGHVFDDGPAPTHQRYCINAAALRFVPLAALTAEGYGDYAERLQSAAPPIPADTENQCTTDAVKAPACATTFETAVLAGGCFWGMEEILRGVPGVVQTEVGYTGGLTNDPSYAEVHLGTTGHAEAVRVVFDPQRLSFATLLEDWFFRMHDPTTKNRQGNDIGTQYRSAIFVSSAEQRRVAEEVRAKVARSGRWQRPIVTEIVDSGAFTPAEGYHQDYLKKNPGGYTCHYLRDEPEQSSRHAK